MNQEKLKQIYDKINDLKGGKVADYIPQLKDVNPDLFGISICMVDGKKQN